MAKKYLSLEEAAQQLGLSVEALNGYRESGDLRGFADRATWKFKVEDVENLGRMLQTDSAPEVPMLGGDDDSIFDLGEELGSEDPTIIRGGGADDILGTSDSDVRLVDFGDESSEDSGFDIPLLTDSDSDVRLVDEGGLLADSDSDVKLVGSDSDSEVRLLPDEGTEGDMDLLDDQGHSDSDIRLIDDSSAGADEPDSGISLELADSGTGSGLKLDSPGSGIVQNAPADSGISLESADSGISLEGADSGITLEAADSGISLESASSGITLESFDSGISLSDDEDSLMLAADSGIALESDSGDDLYQTIPMLDADGDDETGDQTMVEVPVIAGNAESDFEIGALDEGDDDLGEDSAVLLFDDDDDAEATVVRRTEDDDAFDLDDGDEFEDELEVADDDLIGEDDELDVFDADDDDFDDGFVSGESHSDFTSPAPMVMAAREVDWGVGTFVGLVLSALLMSVCCIVVFDLVQSMWGWKEPSAFNSALLSSIRDLF